MRHYKMDIDDYRTAYAIFDHKDDEIGVTSQIS